jgi:hypothetical protein
MTIRKSKNLTTRWQTLFLAMGVFIATLQYHGSAVRFRNIWIRPF